MSLPSPDCTDTRLRQLARVMAHYYDRELGKVGLGTTQYWLLTEVLSHGPLRHCDLGHAMSLSPSTLTRSLEPLIANGWLAVGPGSDGRTRIVSITTAGRRKCAEGLPRWTSAQARVHQLLGSRVVSAMHALLDDCSARMAATQP